MPGGNGTGPMGAGPMTGRSMGRCAGVANGGFGRGRGFRNRFYAAGVSGGAVGYGNFAPYQPVPAAANVSKEQILQSLQEQSEFLEADLKQIKSQIEQLQTEK